MHPPYLLSASPELFIIRAGEEQVPGGSAAENGVAADSGREAAPSANNIRQSS